MGYYIKLYTLFPDQWKIKPCFLFQYANRNGKVQNIFIIKYLVTICFYKQWLFIVYTYSS